MTDFESWDFPNKSSILPLVNSTANGTVFREIEFLYDVPVGIIVVLSLFYGTISILAVIGNILVITIVATTRQMQTVTNLFISNLALADVIIGLFAIPFQFQAAILQRWIFPNFMCPFCPFVQILSVNVSVFTLTAIAVDRHRAILNPLRARISKHISKGLITVIWIVSILLAIPVAVANRVIIAQVLVSNTEYIVKPYCHHLNISEFWMTVYRVSLVLFQYVIPLSVISFVYFQMAIRLWGSRTPGNAQDLRDINLLRNKKKVIKMLIIVVLLFGLCWFPLQLFNFLRDTFPSAVAYRYINIIFFCSDWLAMSNSCINPFIYGIYNEKFKREFHRRFRLRCFFGEYNEVNERQISMHTRVSSLRSAVTNVSTRKPNVIHNFEYGPSTQLTYNQNYGNGNNFIKETNLININSKNVLKSYLQSTTDTTNQQNTVPKNSNESQTLIDWKNNNCECKTSSSSLSRIFRRRHDTSSSLKLNKNNPLYQTIYQNNMSSSSSPSIPLKLSMNNIESPSEQITPSTTRTTITNRKNPIGLPSPSICSLCNKIIINNKNEWTYFSNNLDFDEGIRPPPLAIDDDYSSDDDEDVGRREVNNLTPQLNGKQNKIKFGETQIEMYSLNQGSHTDDFEYFDDDGNRTSFEDIDG